MARRCRQIDIGFPMAHVRTVIDATTTNTRGSTPPMVPYFAKPSKKVLDFSTLLHSLEISHDTAEEAESDIRQISPPQVRGALSLRQRRWANWLVRESLVKRALVSVG